MQVGEPCDPVCILRCGGGFRRFCPTEARSRRPPQEDVGCLAGLPDYQKRKVAARGETSSYRCRRRPRESPRCRTSREGDQPPAEPVPSPNWVFREPDLALVPATVLLVLCPVAHSDLASSARADRNDQSPTPCWSSQQAPLATKSANVALIVLRAYDTPCPPIQGAQALASF